MTHVVKELLIDFKARGENYDHLILTSCMVLVPGHPLLHQEVTHSQLLTECQDICHPTSPAAPLERVRWTLTWSKSDCSQPHVTPHGKLVYSFLFSWCHESCSPLWQCHSLSLFAWAVPLKLSCCSCISIQAAVQAPAFPLLSAKFPFCGHPVLCVGSTKSSCWHWPLGTDINILLMTAQSLFIHLGNASLIIRKPWTERRDKLLNQSSTNHFVMSTFRIVSTITLWFQGLCSNQLLWDRKQRFLLRLLYFPASISTSRRSSAK